MKKFLVILLVISFTFALTTVALAKNGPHMGPGMPQDTDACAGCHRAHTGTGARLLKQGSGAAFCYSCRIGADRRQFLRDRWGRQCPQRRGNRLCGWRMVCISLHVDQRVVLRSSV